MSLLLFIQNTGTASSGSSAGPADPYAGKDLEVWGDSITAGANASPSTLRFSTQLASLLLMTEQNHGTSGEAFQDSIAALSCGRTAYPHTSVAAYSSSKGLLVLAYGVNDVGVNVSASNLANLVKEIITKVEYNINTTGYPKEKIVIVAASYFTGFSNFTGCGITASANQLRLENFVNGFIWAASLLGTKFCNSYQRFKNMATPSSYLDTDQIHLVNAGHTERALQIKDAILNNEVPTVVFKTIDIAASEYFPGFLSNEGKVYFTFGYGTRYLAAASPTGITMVHGGQYHSVIAKATAAYRVSYDIPTALEHVETFSADSLGNNFTAISKVYAFFETDFLIQAGNVYVFGEDRLTVNGGTYITAPIKLNNPSGVLITKLATGFDFGPVYGLGDNGNVYKWDYHGGATPSAVYSGGGVTDLACLSDRALVLIKANDILASGVDLSWINVGTNYSTPTSIKTLAGYSSIVLPIKEISGSLKTIHFIDANDDRHAVGDKAGAGLGNGEDINWGSYSTPYNWNGSQYSIVGPVKLFGKWKNLRTTNNLAYQYYAQDRDTGKWYGWGRNKNYVIANYLKCNNDGTYPNWGDVLYPTELGVTGNPLEVTWPGSEGYTFNPAGTAPTVNAGTDQSISSNNTTLNGSATGSGIVAYQWNQVSGPVRAKIAVPFHPSSGITRVYGLSAGVYVFRLTVTNNTGNRAFDEVQITVS